jgi:hypothetical protein
MSPFRGIDELITCDEQISVNLAILALLPKTDPLPCLDRNLFSWGMFSVVVVPDSITCRTGC